MRPTLLVSLSGASARIMERCVELAGELDRRGVPLSLLVVPRAPGDADTRDWLRHRADAVLMHGYNHNPDPAARNAHRLGRRAEFAGLPAHEAGLRLDAAAALMERLGLRTNAFAPPRWLASPGTLAALRRRGFVLCADATGVRDLRTGVAVDGRNAPPNFADQLESYDAFNAVDPATFNAVDLDRTTSGPPSRSPRPTWPAWSVPSRASRSPGTGTGCRTWWARPPPTWPGAPDTPGPGTGCSCRTCSGAPARPGPRSSSARHRRTSSWTSSSCAPRTTRRKRRTGPALLVRTLVDSFVLPVDDPKLLADLLRRRQRFARSIHR